MKNKLPPDHDLLAKKMVFQACVDAALKSNRKTMKVTIRDKLRLINDELIMFKDSKISYKIIRSLIKEKLELNVSEQTLREHCQQELGFFKRERNKENKSKIDASTTAQELNNNSAIDASIRPEQASRLQDLQETELVTDSNKTALSTSISKQTKSLLNQLENY